MAVVNYCFVIELGIPFFEKKNDIPSHCFISAESVWWCIDHIADIDLSKWMSKSIATVVTTDGKRIVLDDYKYRGMDKLVGALATRFYPDDWTPDARDLKRIREQEAADAASADAGPKTDAGA